jgi:competence protein ComEC
MIAGIAVGVQLDLGAGAWLLGAGFLAVLTPIALGQLGTGAALTLLLAGIFTVSAAWGRTRLYSVEPNHVTRFVGPSQLTTLRGLVVCMPETRKPRTSWQKPRTRFILEADAILLGQAYAPTRGSLRVSVEGALPTLKPGTRVEVACRAGRYSPPSNPGEFDPVARARIDRVFLWSRAPAPQAVRVLGQGRWATLRRLVGHLRAMAGGQLAGRGDQPGLLTRAMVVGERSGGLDKLNDLMRRSGAGHFLSISGLHLSVLLGLAYALCRALLLRPRTSAMVILVLLGLFLLVAQPRPGLLRSAIMAAVLCVGVISARPASALNALALAAILLLAVDPGQLLLPGFQLSFTIVAALLLLMDPMKKLLLGRYLRRRGLRVFRDDQATRRWLYMRAPEILGNYLCISVLAYLAAAPLTAWHFQIFSPYAIVLSLVLFPIVAAVLVPGYLSLALAWLAPNLADRLAQCANWAADELASVVSACQALPLLSIDLYPISFWLAAGWLVALALVVWSVTHRRLRKLAWAPVLVVALASAWSQMPTKAPEVAHLYLLDVGAGQTALLRTPSGQTVVLDAGGAGASEVYARTLRPFLLDQRLPWPDRAFVSHGNADHYTALLDLLSHRSIRTLHLSPHFQREGFEEGEKLLLARLVDAGGKIDLLSAGDVVQLGPRTKVEVLWPGKDLPAEVGRRENETSLVLRVTCDDTSVLIPGDAESYAQSALVEAGETGASGLAPPDLQCDAMILPHHGSWQPTLPDFVRRVDPRIVLVSRRGPLPASGEAGRFYDDLIASRQVYSTARQGGLVLKFGQGKVSAAPLVGPSGP